MKANKNIAKTSKRIEAEFRISVWFPTVIRKLIVPVNIATLLIELKTHGSRIFFAENNY